MPITKVIFIFIICLSMDFGYVDAAIAWSGIVVDKSTKEPIEGAVIVRSWNRYSIGVGGTASILVAVDETTSNHKGEFSISKFKGLFRISIPFLAAVSENDTVIYKPGYKLVEVSEKQHIVEMERIENNYYLRKEENEYASSAGHYNFDIHETTIYKRIVENEEINIKALNRYVDGVIFKGFDDEEVYLKIPIDIGFDTNGNIYVLDEGFNKNIKQFDTNGYYIKSINHNVYLDSLGGIFFDNNDNMYLSSRRNFLKFYKERNYIGFKDYGRQLNFSQGFDFSSTDGSHFVVRNFNLFDTAERDKLSIINIDKNVSCSYRFDNGVVYDVIAYSDEFYTLCMLIDKYDHNEQNKYIVEFDNKCEVLHKDKIEIDNVPTCLVFGNNEIIVSDGYNLYFYDRNYNFKYTEKVNTGFGRTRNDKNSYLGEIQITNMKADKNFNYLYIIDSRYDRILKYNIRTKSWAKKGDKIIPTKVEQPKKTIHFFEGVNGIGCGP